MSRPRPGALPHRLGGEERIEDALADLARDAGAVVDDAHDDALASSRSPAPRRGPTSGTASSALSIRFAQIWLSSPAKPRTRGRSGSARRLHTATDLLRAFDLSTATVLPRPCARSTGSATVA